MKAVQKCNDINRVFFASLTTFAHYIQKNVQCNHLFYQKFQNSELFDKNIVTIMLCYINCATLKMATEYNSWGSGTLKKGHVNKICLVI
jgi:hypothetical protein